MDMIQTVSERIEALRVLMRRERIGAFIFPSTDPHNSEYVPDRWKGREWISGFCGSAGTAVVTMTGAALWTDSRYFLAAAEQLEGTGFVLMKERVEGTPSIAQWIGRELADADSKEVAIDGMCCSMAEAEELIVGLRAEGGLTLRTNLDVLSQIWTDRPSIPSAPICEHPVEYAGETCADKLARVRAALRVHHADGMLVSALDDIAWLLNLRGDDVHCNPVFVSYVLIDSRKATLFIHGQKVPDGVRASLLGHGVEVAGYDVVGQALDKYPEYNILLDPSETSCTLFRRAAARHRVVAKPSPIPAMKAVKNAAEIAGFRRAMVRDGVAMVRFLRWLKPAVEAGGQTEMSIDRKLTALRAEQEHYRGLSFDTIAGYREHGAIVHYEATPETDATLEPRGLLLLDSGAQYADGTTDITRTIALGPLTEEERRIYTLVLKGNIQLALLKFPKGAAGTQLDALARKDLWREGLNYMHGTGHGVGAYLNVHEGPHQIRMEWKPTPLLPGMTVTDEPGIYLAGRFGVRIENTMLITPYMQSEFGTFLQMEPLTLCPIDTTPVVRDMLTEEERRWLNDYHLRVRDTLSPLLGVADREWLFQATQPV